MKRFFIAVIIFSLCFSVSCGENQYLYQNEIQNSDLDEMLKDFVFPQLGVRNLNLDYHNEKLPAELINDLAGALYSGELKTWLRNKNDKSLIITQNDFRFEPNLNAVEYVEKAFTNTLDNEIDNYKIYKFDLNGNGDDEIILLGNHYVYFLKKSNHAYIYAGNQYFGFIDSFSVFQYEGMLYLAGNYIAFDTKVTKAVGLYNLSFFDSERNSNNDDHIYIRKTNDDYNYHLLYRNDKAPFVDDVQDYIDDIGIDLIYANRINNTFYGDEMLKNEYLDDARENNGNLNWGGIYAIDATNDGQDEFFVRKVSYGAGSIFNESTITWYDPETKSVYTAPYITWEPSGYFLSQTWFKIISGKTVSFSLYQKRYEDVYLLDARLHENQETTVLLDYIISLNEKVEIAAYWDYKDTNMVRVAYNDPEKEKAFPNDIDQKLKRLVKEVQGDFTAVDYENEYIPNDMIILLEKALVEKRVHDWDLQTERFEIDVDSFYNKYEGFKYYDDMDWFRRLTSHVYQYKLEGSTFFLIVTDSGGSSRAVDINLFRENDGELLLCGGLGSLDLDARVIMYRGELYVLEQSYNYYSKHVDTVAVYKLVPDGIEGGVQIEWLPEAYEWEKVYSSNQPYDEKVTNYIDSIKVDVMDKSPINDWIEIYIGDEKAVLDLEKQQRLNSVGGLYYYYEIDFNNDGSLEYIERRFWFPSNYTTLYLISNIYQFNDRRIIALNNDYFDDAGLPLQLWFKKIDDKVFTFRLFLYDEYHYFLSVSLIEDADVTQVQSYIIAAKREFNIESLDFK